jgi:hypothetical protein
MTALVQAANASNNETIEIIESPKLLVFVGASQEVEPNRLTSLISRPRVTKKEPCDGV